MHKASFKLSSALVATIIFGSVNSLAIDNLVQPPSSPSLRTHNQSATQEVIVTLKKESKAFSPSRKRRSFSLLPVNPIESNNTSPTTSTPINNPDDNTPIDMDQENGMIKTFKEKIQDILGKNNVDIIEYPQFNAMHIKSDKNSTAELIEMFKGQTFSEDIKGVFPNYMFAVEKSNDTHYDELWAIENSGQEVNNKEGTPDADMDVNEAWEKSKGDSNVIIAVLDTGVDYTHSDLRDNMWEGLSKHGYDFAGDDEGNNDNDPMPDQPYDEKGHYHGTHVAGTIGAVSDNSSGIAGVAQNVSIMALKVFRPEGYAYSSDILEALDFVSERVDAGDNIVAINASFGGGGDQNDATNDAIKKLGEKGVLFCAAAGNDGKNIDEDPVYPASYNASSIIAIAASDQDDKLASFSNYGKNSVDIAAPGTNILSTYPDNQYAYLQGTSMASPNIAGAVALLASYLPASSLSERKSMLLDNVEIKDAFTNKVSSNGRININDALSNENEGKEEENNTSIIAKDDQASTDYETKITIDVLSNDSNEEGSLLIASYTEPTHGSVEKDDEKLVYQPEEGYAGSDNFEYTIKNSEEQSTAKVTITVEEKKKEEEQEDENNNDFLDGFFGNGFSIDDFLPTDSSTRMLGFDSQNSEVNETSTGYTVENDESVLTINTYDNGTVKSHTTQVGDQETELSIDVDGAIEKVNEENIAIIKLPTETLAFIKIESDGKVTPKIKGATLPLEAMPAGTKVNVNSQTITFDIEMSNDIRF